MYAHKSSGNARSTSRMAKTRSLSSAEGHLVVVLLSFYISWMHLLMNEPKNLSCSSSSFSSSQALIWRQPSASAVQ